MSLAQEMRKIAKEYRNNTNVCFMDGIYSKLIECAYHGESHLKSNFSIYGDIIGAIIIDKLIGNGFKTTICDNILTVKW